MSDAIEMGMEGYGAEGDVDKAYQEVCGEIGIELEGNMGTADQKKLGGKKVHLLVEQLNRLLLMT